jgi:hypothetical protein
MSAFAPQLRVLPPAQRRLWVELPQVPKGFVLYGGTAVGLWLGHLDLAALMRAGVGLADMLGAAAALYAGQFNPLISLKALSYFGDGDLPSLPDEVKDLLRSEAAAVHGIPEIRRRADDLAPGT